LTVPSFLTLFLQLSLHHSIISLLVLRGRQKFYYISRRATESELIIFNSFHRRPIDFATKHAHGHVTDVRACQHIGRSVNIATVWYPYTAFRCTTFISLQYPDGVQTFSTPIPPQTATPHPTHAVFERAPMRI
jgi:hypothetical protein